MALRIKNEILEPGSDKDAQELQIRLHRELRLGGGFRTVGAVDVAYSKTNETAYVAAVVLSTSNWQVVSQQRLKMKVQGAYEPDMLGFREGPLILDALTHLAIEPDVILLNGTGTAHPRQFGLACHVGYALEHPTVGVTTTWPPGCVQKETIPVHRRGTKVALLHETSGGRVGYEVYTQDNANPIYVSPGDRISLDDAASVVLRSALFYRIPEPLKVAGQVASEYRNLEEG